MKIIHDDYPKLIIRKLYAHVKKTAASLVPSSFGKSCGQRWPVRSGGAAVFGNGRPWSLWRHEAKGQLGPWWMPVEGLKKLGSRWPSAAAGTERIRSSTRSGGRKKKGNTGDNSS